MRWHLWHWRLIFLKCILTCIGIRGTREGAACSPEKAHEQGTATALCGAIRWWGKAKRKRQEWGQEWSNLWLLWYNSNITGTYLASLQHMRFDSKNHTLLKNINEISSNFYWGKNCQEIWRELHFQGAANHPESFDSLPLSIFTAEIAADPRNVFLPPPQLPVQISSVAHVLLLSLLPLSSLPFISSSLAHE